MNDSYEPTRCPLCGSDNQCGVAAGKSNCWCTVTEIAPEVLALVPSKDDQVCICPRCAAGDVPSPCVEICELDTASGTCRGCQRTIQEITSWRDYSVKEKLAVLRRIRESGIRGSGQRPGRDA